MLYVLRSAVPRRDAIPLLRTRPELRKATDQMLWAYAAAARCLEAFPAQEDSLGLVVGSGQGELETTKEYYKWLARENSPRPFLFQNSLHHSTTGMLSMALKIRGAAATVSDHFFSAESALDLASTLLASRQCETCLVVGVDTIVPDLAPGVRARYPASLEFGEGAARAPDHGRSRPAGLGLPLGIRDREHGAPARRREFRERCKERRRRDQCRGRATSAEGHAILG